MMKFDNHPKKIVPQSIHANGKILRFDRCRIMGIVNVTHNSFFEQSRTIRFSDAQKKIAQQVAEGADIIDIGGMSTRPFSEEISEEEECARVVPLVSWARKEFPHIFISIDTYRSGVAQQCAAVGADIINDISAGMLDEHMLRIVAANGLPYIAMHMQGTPQNMQLNPQYDHVVTEVLDFLLARKAACKEAGIHQIIWDPGFGFGKTVEHNYQLLRHFDTFHILEGPLLAGISRKGMIWKPLQIQADEALPGSLAAHTLAIVQGANILRVHDVAATVQIVEVARMFSKATN